MNRRRSIDSDNHKIADQLALPPSEAEMQRLTARLARETHAAGVLDLTYRTVDSPYGSLLIVASVSGIVRIAFQREDHDVVLGHLAEVISPRILRSGQRTDDAARQLAEYFARRRETFDLPIDLQLLSGYRRTVVEHLSHIGYGATASYADVARATGNPNAVRAVGSACSRNPLPVIVPCHRVVRSDGKIGQYLGGTEVKAALLAMEAGNQLLP